MFNLPSINKDNLLTIENLLNKVSELEIYRHFIGYDFIVGKAFLSPLRNEQKNSFGIYFKENLKYKYYFKDFNGSWGNIFTFVCDLNNRPFNLQYALKTINDEMNVGLREFSSNPCSNSKEIKEPIRYKNYIKDSTIKDKYDFRIITRNMTQKEIQYWKQGCITEEILKKFNVYYTQEVWWKKNDEMWSKIWINTPEDPVYSYYFPKTNHFKHYRPFAKEDYYGNKYKWLSNCDINDIQGYENLPEKGSTLIITKSLKDVMTLHALGFNAISFHAEGVYLPDIIMKELFERFDNIICYYDNDNVGKQNSIRITQDYNIKHFNNPDNYEEKDAFALVSKYGKELLIDLLAKKQIYPNDRRMDDV